MVVALLGLGTVGKSTYNAIINKESTFFNDILIKYILVKNTNKHRDIPDNVLTDSFDKIINDDEVETIIEMTGSSDSYYYITESLNKRKNVITASKEVISNHFSELEKLASEKGVSLLYEAAVGGGIPIVNTLNNLSSINKIYKIEGILNGTTNFILSNMHIEKNDFESSLLIAQKRGFAEADSSSDFLGLDMVRKISILSQIAYKTEIDNTKVYRFGIQEITKEIIDIVSLIGYTLKFVCYSELRGNSIYIGVEPIAFKSKELFSSVNYEYNVIRYYGNHCGVQTMVGKGAGPITANSILNDIKLLYYGYKSNYSIENNYVIIGPNKDKCRLFIKYKDKSKLENIIDADFDGIALTKKIDYDTLINNLDNISFYARIYE